MGHSVNHAAPSDPVLSSDFPRPNPVKAGLRSDCGVRFRDVRKALDELDQYLEHIA